MDAIKQLLLRVRMLFQKQQFETDLNDEIRFHLDMQTQENIRNGMSPQDARTAALRRFGGPDQIKEGCRDQRSLMVVDGLWGDLCYGTRSLARTPGFTFIVVFTLALAIGANTAIFSVLNAVLLKPLPFPDNDRLVMLWEHDPETGVEEQMATAPAVSAWRETSQSFEQFGFIENASSGTRQFVFGDGDDAQRVKGRFASSGLFETLGVNALLGRTIHRDEDERGRELVAVLSHSFWQRSFDGDPAVVGRTLEVANGTRRGSWRRTFRIVGVMPAGFQFPPEAEFWLSLSGHPWFNSNRIGPNLWAVGRLKPGVTPPQAAADLSAIQERFAAEHPEAPDLRSQVKVVPLQQQVSGEETGTALLTLFGSVMLVLLIASANVANLLLARGARRQKELAVRIALGAGRWRVIRQLMTESLLLVLAGGGLGLLLAVWGVMLLRGFPFDSIGTSTSFRIDRFQDVSIDWTVLGFSLLICLGTSLLIGLVPALQASRVNVNESLKEEGRGSAGSVRGNRFRRVLLVSEVALAMALLIGAGLMMRSFWQLRQVDPGLTSENVVTAAVDLPMASLAFPGDAHEVMRQVVERARAVPGVESVAVMAQIPLRKGGSSVSLILDSEEDVQSRPSYPAHKHIVSPGSFDALGIPLLSGRDFAETDNLRSPPVVIINRTVAERFFPNEDPVGKRIMPQPAGWPVRSWVGLEIIGVVGDVRHIDLSAEVSPEVYTCHLQLRAAYWGRATLVVRTTHDPTALSDSLRDTIEGDKLQGKVLTEFQTMNGILDDALATERLSAILLSLFAGVALVLASTGIYGVVSYSAAQRTQEFGIRIALGAQPGHVLKLVLREGLGFSLLGIGIGVSLCLAGTRVLESLLYGVEPTDAATYFLLATVLTVVALLACYVPARRAMRADPMTALRHE